MSAIDSFHCYYRYKCIKIKILYISCKNRLKNMKDFENLLIFGDLLY